MAARSALGGTMAVAAAAIAAGALLGAVVARNPRPFHFDLGAGPWAWAGLATATAITFWLVRRPRAALAILVVFVYLNLSEVLVRFHGLPSLLQLLVAPIAIAAFVARPRREAVAVATHGLTLLLAAWVLWLLASTVWAWDPGLAAIDVAEAAKAFVLYLLVVLLVDSAPRLRLAVRSLLGAGCLLAALGVYQALTRSFAADFGGLARVKDAHIYGDVFEPRIAGPLGDPNFFAQVLLVLVPLALALAWHGRSGGERLAAAGAAGLLVAGTVLTYSRGGALALAAVLVLAWLGRGIRLREVAAGLAVVAVALLAVPEGFTRRLTTLQQITGGEQAALYPDSSFEKRRLVSLAAWEMFQDHPGAGVGAGNFTARFSPYADRVGSAAREYDEPFGESYPHNLYLEIGAETGLVGLALFGAAVAVALAYLEGARRRLAAAGLALEATLAGATAIALVGYLVSSLFLHGHFQRYLWLLLALAAALHDLGRRSAARGAPTAPAPGGGELLPYKRSGFREQQGSVGAELVSARVGSAPFGPESHCP
ncbi:MAG TPA: O-antigen ligase family protein [Thermoanaerobaculia bacterium]|nr:O-antigen ligase family protein [Thermoanaerobaculia bacterium]